MRKLLKRDLKKLNEIVISEEQESLIDIFEIPDKFYCEDYLKDNYAIGNFTIFNGGKYGVSGNIIAIFSINKFFKNGSFPINNNFTFYETCELKRGYKYGNAKQTIKLNKIYCIL